MPALTWPVLPAMIDFNPAELLIIMALGVLLFGERLPEVGKSVGKQLSQLKKGIRGIQDQIQGAVNSATTSSSESSSYGGEVYFEDIEEREEATAPKFEPPPAPPSPSATAASLVAGGTPGVTPAAPPGASAAPAKSNGQPNAPMPGGVISSEVARS